MNRPERVLIAQPYGIGDAIFMLPFLKALKVEKGAERIDLILGSRTRQLLENCPYVDAIYVIDKDKWKAEGKLKTFRERFRLIRTFRKKRYTLCVDLSMQPEYSFWARFALFVPVVAGFDYKRRNGFLTHRLSLPPEGFSGKSVGEYYGELGCLLGMEVRDKKPSLPLLPEYHRRAEALLQEHGMKPGRFVAVSPGGGATWGKDASFKHWPPASFAQFLEFLRPRIGFDGIVVLGTQEESALGESLRQATKMTTANLCGRTSLPETAALIKKARFFLGNDGGLVHLAVSQDTPLIAVYGPADPAVYGPYPREAKFAVVRKGIPCQPCYRSFRYNDKCSSRSCLRDFAPAEALGQIEAQGFLKSFR